MLTLEQLVHNLRKTLRDNYQSVGDSMIAGGAQNYEQYRYMLGQAKAYQSMDQALTDMLNPKEEKKGEDVNVEAESNVVQFRTDD